MSMFDIINIKNKNVELIKSFIIVTVLSLIICYFSNFFENKNIFYKKDDLYPTFSVLVIRFIHYFIIIILTSYYYIFDTSYDLYFLAFYSIIIFHWIVTDMCVLAEWESLHYYDNEAPEKNLYHNIFYRVFSGDYIEYVFILQGFLMSLNFILVIKRFNYNCYKYLFGAVMLFLQIYLMIFPRMYLFNIF